jgi:3-phosphoshikimate 1-carboxyvinyltransferase
MPLPEIIEIAPLRTIGAAQISIPGSKSITNRALLLAALADGVVTLRGALWSEDTQVLVEALQLLGFEIDVQPDPAEWCNRVIRVTGLGGTIPRGGTAEAPLELFVGNAGTAARFLAALVCLGHGVYRLSGTERMHQRPQAALFYALRQLGYRIESTTDQLPAEIFGTGPSAAACQVDLAQSSQFGSALLLCAGVGGWDVTISGDDAEEAPYVAMTRKLIGVFPKRGGEFQIEIDASSASYFWAANWLLSKPAREFEAEAAPQICLATSPSTDWQIDAAFPRFLPLPAEISRRNELGDSIMTAMILAPFAGSPTRFSDLGRLRLQECERVAALRSELTKCGVTVVENGDALTVFPAAHTLRGSEVETYNDHRMAMCFAILGLRIPGVKIKNPSCVKKTFPNFFQKLATVPPAGLGTLIMDASTGQPLRPEQLFAE